MSESIYTRPHYRILSEIAARHGARVAELASVCGITPTHTRKLLHGLMEAGYVEKGHGLHYISEGGVAYLADHSGIAVKEVKGLLTLAPKPGELRSTVRMKRRKAIGETRTRFAKEGFFVADGRQMGIGGLNTRRQWHPDLWVSIPTDKQGVVWHAVVVDPSSQSENVLGEILRNYRDAHRRDKQNWPLLVVCRDETAAAVLGELGDDLAMMVATYRGCLNGPFYGGESAWRFWGEVADVDFLSRQSETN